MKTSTIIAPKLEGGGEKRKTLAPSTGRMELLTLRNLLPAISRKLQSLTGWHWERHCL